MSYVSFLVHKEEMKRRSATTDSGGVDEDVWESMSDGRTELCEEL